MRGKIITFISVLCVALLILAAGCYEPGGPVPEDKHPGAEQAWTSEDVDSMVLMEEETIYSPAPTENGKPPPVCDYIHFLRFRLKESSGDPGNADAILVLIPGFLGGANSMHNLGRQLVYMARTLNHADLEVWLFDRRPNNLEDLTGVNAAEEARDTQVAIDYYYHGAEIDGRVFDGFMGDEDIPYLSEFGLELAMEDWYTIITTMVPDPEERREKVFVGGHSLGGPLTALFAGWDFDGDPSTLDDAGYMNCAGLVGLDTRLVASFDTSSLHLSQMFGVPPFEDAEGYAAVVGDIRRGSLPRIVPVPTIYPEYLTLLESLAMEAAWHPDQESTLLKRVPISEDIDFLGKLLHSRSLDHFLLHIPDLTDFRYTNEAMLGLVVDDNFQFIVPLQVSCGFLSGGAVVDKNFPLPQDLASIPELSELLGSLMNMEGQFIANDAGPSCFSLGRGPLYTWANFDEIGDEVDPDYQDEGGTLTFTTKTEEMSDIQDVARFLYRGPTNAMEWYYAMRLTVDMEAAPTDYGPEVGLSFLHEEHIDDLPQIEFVAEGGPAIDLSEGVDLIEGYNHLDVVTEATNRPSHQESKVFQPLIDFILENI